MEDLNLSSIASSLETIASEINLTCIKDSLDKLGDDIRDLKESLDYLIDKIEGEK